MQSLKLSDLDMTTTAETYTVDALLSTLFPLCPFLMHLELSLTLQLSRRSFASLALTDGAQNLRALTGVRYDAASAGSGSWEDPLAELVSCCSGLEELEVVGTKNEERAKNTGKSWRIDQERPSFVRPRLRRRIALADRNALCTQVILRLCDFLCIYRISRVRIINITKWYIHRTFISSSYASGVSLNVYKPCPRE